MKPVKIHLMIECGLLYGLIPGLLVYYQMQGGIPFLPVLFGFLLVTLIIGLVDPQVRFRPETRRLPFLTLAPRLAGAALGLTAITAIFYPHLLFRLPKENPPLWLLVMLLYPILSVAPQEFLFRTFFMQRYRPLFGDGFLLCLVNALAFGWAHAFFLNWIAPLLSIPAGWLLARSWQQSHSFKRVCLEHAVYGQIVFTCGLGWFFYQGSTRALQQLTP